MTGKECIKKLNIILVLIASVLMCSCGGANDVPEAPDITQQVDTGFVISKPGSYDSADSRAVVVKIDKDNSTVTFYNRIVKRKYINLISQKRNNIIEKNKNKHYFTFIYINIAKFTKNHIFRNDGTRASLDRFMKKVYNRCKNKKDTRMGCLIRDLFQMPKIRSKENLIQELLAQG